MSKETYGKYLRDLDAIEALRTQVVNPVISPELRVATAKNLIAVMNLRGIPITRYVDGPPDLFEFAVCYTELMVQVSLELPTPAPPPIQVPPPINPLRMTARQRVAYRARQRMLRRSDKDNGRRQTRTTRS